MATGIAPGTFEETEARVLDVVRALARELGGERAARAVTPTASLDGDVGLGSLEKVELLSRLESAFGHPFDDRCLALDSARDLARRIASGVQPVPRAEAPPRAADRLAPATPAGPARTVHEALWSRADEHPQRPHVFMREE